MLLNKLLNLSWGVLGPRLKYILKTQAMSTDRDKLTMNKLTENQQFRHSDLVWFRHSYFVTKWGFGQDGSGDSKMCLWSFFSANRRHFVRSQLF